jgi:ATP-dependent DNA ligase
LQSIAPLRSLSLSWAGKKMGRDVNAKSAGIVFKRKASSYRSGRSPDWLKSKNPACAAVQREVDEDWGR